jgi:transcriptional regulator with XRE-family HTH domain
MYIDVKPDQLRAARHMAGWTQDELADLSGISRITIANLEAGRVRDPKSSTIRLLARALQKAGVEITETGVERRRARELA